MGWRRGLLVVSVLLAGSSLAVAQAPQASPNHLAVGGGAAMTQPVPSLVALFHQTTNMQVGLSGTYQVVAVLGTDTAVVYFRTTATPLAPLVADSLRRPQAPIAPAGLVLPVLIAADSGALDAPGLAWDRGAPPPHTGRGLLFMAMADSNDSRALWQVTLLGGGDSTGNTGWARISRAMGRAVAEPERRTAQCRTQAGRLNKAAQKAGQPPVCDGATGLPLFRAGLADNGRLIAGKDGHISISQKTETEEGEVVLWGKRVSRTVVPSP